MDNILITTTVSLDINVQQPLMAIHLVQGNYGTRALRLVPTASGRLMDLENVTAASVGMSCPARQNLEIDCEVADHYVTLVPTQAMTASADEWLCQLNLYNAQNEVLSSAPFKIIVHGDVYEGDAVEHTDARVSAVYFDDNGKIVIERMDGETVTSADDAQHGEHATWAHRHDNATETADGFMPKEAVTAIETLQTFIATLNAGSMEVTFGKVTVGSGANEITLNNDGTITGAVFT